MNREEFNLKKRIHAIPKIFFGIMLEVVGVGIFAASIALGRRIETSTLLFIGVYLLGLVIFSAGYLLMRRGQKKLAALKDQYRLLREHGSDEGPWVTGNTSETEEVFETGEDIFTLIAPHHPKKKRH